MAERQPIGSAPRDGRQVTVYWTDGDGVENESQARYRAEARPKGAAPDWNDGDAGWWAFVDSDTQKRVRPHSWRPTGDDEE